MASFMKKVLHSTSTKSPHDLVDRAVGCACRITDTASERQQEELAKYLAMMKVGAQICAITGTLLCLLAQIYTHACYEECRACARASGRKCRGMWRMPDMSVAVDGLPAASTNGMWLWMQAVATIC